MNLFRQAVEGVVPLRTPARSDSKVPGRASRKRRHESMQRLAEPTPGMDSDLEVLPDFHSGPNEQDTSHRKNGVQLKIMQKLKRGHFPPADQFDLHHLNTHSGKTELLKFIASAQQRGFRCIRVIHGKGLRSKDGPRLKLMVRHILRGHPQIQAYTACKPADGGDGATDVLLKRSDS